MPDLNREGLEAPRFHRTDWKVGQRFSGAQHDPDRTREPWEPPAFVQEDDPLAQRAGTESEELSIAGTGGASFARVLRRVLSEAQCASLLARVNSKGFTPALLNIGSDLQELQPGLRDGHRVIVDSPELASWLLEVLRPHLPEELPGGAHLVGLNERMRVLCYTPGQSFEAHYDGRYTRPRGHPGAFDHSRVTVQLYLNDVPAGFGGATTFSPGCSHQVECQPEAGSALLFTQDLEHEGSLLREGIKYTLRTEAMYRRGPPAALSG